MQPTSPEGATAPPGVTGEGRAKPSICRIVVYRSRTGDYDVPAIITATADTLNPKGVELFDRTDGEQGVPPLSGEEFVHLTVFTPGLPGFDISQADFKVAREHGPESGIINFAGCYQEWDIPFAELYDELYDDSGTAAPGTWRWPVVKS